MAGTRTSPVGAGGHVDAAGLAAIGSVAAAGLVTAAPDGRCPLSGGLFCSRQPCRTGRRSGNAPGVWALRGAPAAVPESMLLALSVGSVSASALVHRLIRGYASAMSGGLNPQEACLSLRVIVRILICMLASRTAAIAFTALTSGALLVGCSQQAPIDASRMVIKSVGPADIQAGKKFNVQPDGSSALWLNTQGVTATAVPVLAGVELSGVNVRDNGTLVTALVPEKLTAKPGSYPLFLRDRPTGKTSNEVTFVVK